jgi:hypothetical protein
MERFFWKKNSPEEIIGNSGFPLPFPAAVSYI